MRTKSGYLSFIVVLLAGSCAHTPVPEPRTLAGLLEHVTRASRALIDDHVRTVEELRARERTQDQTAYPLSFDPEAENSDPADPFAESFRNAIAALELYRNAIRAASDDHGANAIERGADAAASLLSSADPVGGAIAELMKLIAQARDRARLDEVIHAGARPAGEILGALVDATPDLYRVRVGVVGEAQSELAFDLECVFAEIERTAGTYAPPEPGTPDALDRARLETELAAMRSELHPQYSAQPLPVGVTPYELSVQQRLQQQFGVARSLREQQRSNAKAVTEYHRQLGDYVRLIAEAQRELASMTEKNGKNNDE